MEDLIKKIEKLFGIRQSASQQDIPHPADFIFDLVEMLPKIMGFFDQLSGRLKHIVDDVDETGAENCTQLFTDETNYIKICFGQCLRLLSDLYTWSGFDEQRHRELLNSKWAEMGVDKCRPENKHAVIKNVVHKIGYLLPVSWANCLRIIFIYRFYSWIYSCNEIRANETH